MKSKPISYKVKVRGNDFNYEDLDDAMNDGHPGTAKVYFNLKETEVFLGTIKDVMAKKLATLDEVIDFQSIYEKHLKEQSRNTNKKKM